MTDSAGTTSPIERNDAIKIVPLSLPDGLLQLEVGPPAPRLTYRGGPLLTAVEVVTIFWGSAWQNPPLAGQATSLNQFFDFILTSSFIDALAEYDTPSLTIGHGRHTGTTTLTTPTPPSTVSDAAIQSLLQNAISSGALPPATANTLYFLYLPPGTVVSQGGGRSCLTFCGYHDATGNGLYYAVMPYAGCSGCTGGMSVLDALTTVSSHELAEAITDPVPGTGWYDDTHGEIGDICAWQTAKLGSFTVQLLWSNSRNACNGLAPAP